MILDAERQTRPVIAHAEFECAIGQSRVDFDLLREAPATKKTARRLPASAASTRRSVSAQERVAALMHGFGIRRGDATWKGKSSAVIARMLRQQAAGDRFRG